jgi:ssDNA-binding Zn-finger/Zn-ribbon topoisomerase 1
MGLKCSVLGHKYGETTVEREREEQGSEVVITIQERETCERCGETRIVSENKEVTAIETPSDIASDLVEDDESESETAAASDTSEPATDETVGTTDEPDDDGAGSSDGWDSVDDPVEAPGDAGVADGVADDGEAVDPSADDAEIIDDSGESASESDDEGVDVELDEPTTTVDVPDAEGEEPVTEDETDPEKDDGLILGEEEETSESADGDRQPGEWPDEPGDDGDDWSPETMPVDTGDDSDVEPVSDNAVTVPEGEFACPECGFTTEVESTSLREGDFCPECHKGSLITQREE